MSAITTFENDPAAVCVMYEYDKSTFIKLNVNSCNDKPPQGDSYVRDFIIPKPVSISKIPFNVHYN